MKTAQGTDIPRRYDAGVDAPLSYAQQRLWFVHQLEPTGAALNIASGVSIAGRLDAAALAWSLCTLARRHASLRTRFPVIGGRPVQRTTPAAIVDLSFVEMGGVPAGMARPETDRMLRVEAGMPFDIGRAPLFRVRVFRFTPTAHVTSIVMHHIISDGWSMNVFLKELATLYDSRVNGVGNRLPQLPIQYADYAVWQRRWFEEGHADRQLAYWTQHLAGIVREEAEQTRHVRSSRSATVSFKWPASLSQDVRALARRHQCTLFMLLLAAYQVALHGRTGQLTIAVGTDTAGRQHRHTEGLIGFFVNQLVLVTDLRGEPTFAEVLRRIRALAAAAYANQDVPFDRIVKALRPQRHGQGVPLFRWKMVLHNTPHDPTAVPAIRLTPFHLDTGASENELNLIVSDAVPLTGRLLFSTDLYSEMAATRLVERVQEILAMAVQNPSVPIATMAAEGGADGRKDPRALRLLKTSQRQAVAAAPGHAIVAAPTAADDSLPLVVRAHLPDLDPVSWATEHREWIYQRLHRNGAVLFRNWDVHAVGGFERFAKAIVGSLVDYKFRASPRREVAARIYTSTEYRADQTIFPHNEHAYSAIVPRYLFFFCVTPAEDGGETPLGDCRRVLAAIDPAVRAAFARRGVTYVRNYGDGFGLPWETVFQTASREQVESYCREHGIQYIWKSEGRLRTTQTGPAIVRHPVTGETSWFNHATFFHVTTLEPSMRAHLLATLAEADLPNNTYYGDGAPIEPDVLEHLRAVYAREMTAFSWQRGDVLLVDNILTAHARRPYRGPREILVAMATPVRQAELTLEHASISDDRARGGEGR